MRLQWPLGVWGPWDPGPTQRTVILSCLGPEASKTRLRAPPGVPTLTDPRDRHVELPWTMDVTKTTLIYRVWAMDVTKPYKFIGFGAMDITRIL